MMKKCVGKESFQRINYLYQATNALVTESRACNIASSLYSNLLICISKKTVQRIDIEIKRTICKRCRSLLLAGLNAKVRMKKKNIIWTCLVCKNQKIFATKNKSYCPWTQKLESLVEILDYTRVKNISTD